MTKEQLLDELRKLRTEWEDHYELGYESPDWCSGVDAGYSRAADSLNELITRAEK